MAAVRPLRDPTPGAERRGALRHPVRMEATLACGHAMPMPVEVTDISETGCRIVRPDALAPDVALLLGFGGFTPVEAVVAWTAPASAGLRFLHRVHPALIGQVVSAAKGRRMRPRLLSPALVRREERARLWHLRLEVGLEEAAAPASIRPLFTGLLCDLSVEGCRIVSDAALAVGTGLLVHIAGQSPMLGEVRWCEGGVIGLAFGAPLAPDMIARIAGAAPAGGRSSRG